MRPAAWRWATLFEDPHRIAFLTAMTALIGASVWWTVILAVRAFSPTPAPFVVAPGLAHAFVMTGSFMPMFFAGFLYTVGPRWLHVPPVDGRALLRPAVIWLAGWTLFAAGAQTGFELAAAGLLLVTLAWSVIALRLRRMAGTSGRTGQVHFQVISWACAIGAATFAGATIALAGAAPAWLIPLESVLIGLFIAPVFAAALHRMVPLVHVAWPTVEDRFEHVPLYVLIAAFALEPLVRTTTAVAGGGLPAIFAFAYLFVVDAAMAGLLFQLAWRWRAGQNMRIRLLAMFFSAIVWLALAFALHAVEALAVLTGSEAAGLRLAGLHALTMGFFGSVMMAMVSRVTCGQAGRTMASERIVWRLFLILQAAAAIRVLAEIATADASGARILVLAALLWCAAMLPWSLRYINWYGRPRTDARARAGTVRGQGTGQQRPGAMRSAAAPADGHGDGYGGGRGPGRPAGRRRPDDIEDAR